MQLSPKTKVNDLLKQFPFLTDWLAEFNPKFAGLKNPVLRNTLGRVANMSKVAAMGDVQLPELLEAIRERIREESTEEVEINLGDLPLTNQQRQEVLKTIIRDLHSGKPMTELKQRFAELIEDVGPEEIAALEQALIAEGMPQSEIQRLCDVHVEVFRESLRQQQLVDMQPGHPVRTFMDENRALGTLAEEIAMLLSGLCDPAKPGRLELIREQLELLLVRLQKVDIHYARKENQLFPFLEKHGITGPPQVMWGIHDEIRAGLKSFAKSLQRTDADAVVSSGQKVAQQVADMIYKEDNILYPMALSILSEAEWAEIRSGEKDIGYALVEPGNEWQPTGAGHGGDEVLQRAAVTSALPMQTGLLSLEQVNLLLTHLPIEISFTDENDVVRYFSDTPHRVFPRSAGVIGRDVENCHPPKSLHMVREILSSFRDGSQDKAEFWIELQGRFLHICYFALRDAQGKFRGTMETIQDATELRALQGERRLLEWGKS